MQTVHIPETYFNVPTPILRATGLASLDVCQSRVMLALVGAIRVAKLAKDADAVKVAIPAAELLDAYPGHERAKVRLWDDLKIIGRVEFEHTEMDETGDLARGEWATFAAKISADFPGGLVQLTMTRDVVTLIQTPDTWARIAKEALFSMRSKHAQRLYQLIQGWEGAGKRHERREWLWIDKFREAMQIGDAHQDFRALHRYVIKPAVDEINALELVEVEVIPHRRGRPVREFEIKWKPKTGTKAADTAATLDKPKRQRKAKEQAGDGAPPVIEDSWVAKFKAAVPELQRVWWKDAVVTEEGEKLVITVPPFTANWLSKSEYSVGPRLSATFNRPVHIVAG